MVRRTTGYRSYLLGTSIVLMFFAVGIVRLGAQTPVGNPTESAFKEQDYQRPEKCLPCHQRQYDELHSSVKSGYRNVSPLFNGLEMSGNLLSGGLLRPVYKDSTVVLPDGVLLNTNMFTSSPITETRQSQAGFCFTCHNPHVERLGDTNLHAREVPQLPGLQVAAGAGRPAIVLEAEWRWAVIDRAGRNSGQRLAPIRRGRESL